MIDPKGSGEVPAHIKAAINRWVEYRDYPGGFLTAVLHGDLFGAFRAGNAESLAALPAILRYLHWEVPSECYGSSDKVSAWAEGPVPPTAAPTLLRTANAPQLASYLDAAHDIGEAKGERKSE